MGDALVTCHWKSCNDCQLLDYGLDYGLDYRMDHIPYVHEHLNKLHLS